MSCKILKKSNKEFVFTNENKDKFEFLLTRYPNKQALLLPTLWLVQHQDGWISYEAVEYIANLLGLSSMYVYSVASFYAMYSFAPHGQHHIKVCKTLSCNLRGSEEIIAHIKNKLNISLDEDTNMYSLSEVECLGHCELAPTIAINEEFFTSLDIDTLDNILDNLCK